MNTWKTFSATVLTASVLFLGIPAGGADAQESINYSIFDLSGVIKEGSKGESVKNMQRALNLAMGAELSEDGIFGPNTKTAVLAFQESKKLAKDGVYGPNTHAALSKAVNSFGFADSVLKVGSRGEAVKTLQKGLVDMSYEVSVDGVFGPQTKVALIKFQERFPELANDGVFGPKTKAVMDKVLND
ncbi:peptidoglycan hydrolase-like protein with peptidoglycan-binding domain [Bacillus mesophilus]|uniref:Peptidoglycan-binding protein n=1 Tax=Bacillus mesophilus TaxID=1808955 RepID=A0A6M0Q7W7_9BACI|nr:peptidoglycan-binding protein [Bacillus mesophilus]MBM7662194.1 peptidoglycan hydrolase-like protein with peptidoglycan-binding domain [Bacillus mesophilus]NEY72455.1 peptidoglycan-binding protein [Bacillus mesophilus]